MTDGPSATASEFAPSEMPVSVGEASPTPASFPPYPPYAMEPAPPSVADTIFAGREIRVQHKSGLRPPVRPAPRPARPRGPKATDVKLSRKQLRAHARCLRRHGAVLTDRLERMSKPQRRRIIYLWREHQDMLPADTINRLRQLLDADEPFKPDQAYEYFINLRKTKKMKAQLRVNQIKKDSRAIALCTDKRFSFARNATVAFARGIQQRLSRPGRYALADGMLRLSNIILDDMCGYMRVKTPSRACRHPKAKFMIEMSDKVAVWIDEILSESDDRMLMMDFDEDEDVYGADEAGDDGFADDFLNMMGGGGLLRRPQPAYMKFTGEMLDAFNILTGAMQKKGDQNLLTCGKFSQTYGEGADELKRATDFNATEYNTDVAAKLKNDLADTVKPDTPKNIEPYMKDMVDICSNYLAQNAEYSKDKGAAFKLLIKQMKAKGNAPLYRKEKASRSYASAAAELEKAKGLDTDHDDPNLSQQIHSALSKAVETVTPDNLKPEMKETLDKCSKYLSQAAADESERGPAFDLLIQELEKHGADDFTPEHQCIGNKFAAAYVLKSSPGLSSVKPDPATVDKFTKALHRAVDGATPRNLVGDMNEVVKRCADYLSAFVRDRDKAMETLLRVMKSKPTTEFAKRNNYSLNYGTGAMEVETAPAIVPYLPIKDIADKGELKLSADVESSTPPELKVAMKSAVQDVSKYLSQPVALRSGAAGERYPLNFLTATMKSLGKRPLYKHKSYGQSYADGAEVLTYAGQLEHDPKAEELQHKIATEITHGGMPLRLAPTINKTLEGTITEASKHLAKVGNEKAVALDHLVKEMKDKGDAPLGQMQGYMQTYADGARRIENAPNLANDKVDKGAYEVVRGKLTQLVTEHPPPTEQAKVMPGVVDDASKFLAAPMPETAEEKRQILADLMGRKGDKILGEEGLYKITYKEGGDEIKAAPIGVTKARNEEKIKELGDKINQVIPDKKMQEMLKEPVNEGSAHISDAIKGRAEAMQTIHDNLKKEKQKPFLTVGKFSKTHSEVALMLEQAPHFGGQQPSPVIHDAVKRRMEALNKDGASDLAKQYMNETVGITSEYIAGIATKECGLDAKALAALAASGGLGGPSGRRPGETEEEYRRRLAAEAAGGGRRPGETEEEYRRRLAEEAAGGGRRPGETEEEYRRRLATEAAGGGRRPGETEEEYRRRLADEAAGGGRRPGETEEEYRRRLATEAAGGGRRPGETEEEYRRRLADEAAGGGRRPGETEEEYRRRLADEAARGGRRPGETEEEYRRRLAAEAAGGGRRPGETEEEYRRRLADEAAGGDRRPGETEEEYQRRLAAEVAGGGRRPGETEEEYRRRLADEAAGGGRRQGETEEEYQRRLAAEAAGGGRRPGETEEEYRRRLADEAAGGGRRPGETEEEYRRRLADEAAGGGRRPGETEEEYRRRLADEARGGGRRPGETEEEYRRRLADEAAGGGRRPGETEEEYRRRLADEAAGGGRRPGETEEEYRKRLAAEEAAGRRRSRLPGETDEEYRRRMAAEEAARKGGAGAGSCDRRPGETEEEYRKRMALEKATRRATAVAGGRRPGETEEEYLRRMSEEARRGGRLPGETEEEYRRRKLAEEAALRAGAGGRRPGETEEEYRRRIALHGGDINDTEREAALKILHTQLLAKGNEMFYKQPHSEVTYAQASAWLSMSPAMKVDKTVKESGDTARLSKKFERKLSNLVAKVTPSDMYDVMQDVIIESARILSEYFVSCNYKALARDGLISEMQKRGNEILVELDGAVETSFFAAQRLKKAKTLDVKEPCDQISYYLTKKLEEIVRCKAMPRKVTPTMKEHIKDAANYLSEHVTKPDEQIEAYVAMLGEMEAHGDSLLIEGDIPKSYKDAAAYLRHLTSFEDQINKPNSSLQSSTESKLKSIVANVPPRGYTKSILDGVIKNSAALLVSYIMLQGEKTEAMKCLIERMEQAGQNVLLRHGNIRKNYEDGAETLRGKNADQLSVESADPVVSRKIQIKLDNLMSGCTPDKFQNIIDAVIEETTMYLAVHLLEPRLIRVCKCMKSVFVQCELWCEEILRRVARPGCPCSRHEVQAGTSRTLLELRTCPSRAGTGACPAARPTPTCGHQSTYMTYPSLVGWESPPRHESPSRRSSPGPLRPSPTSSCRESSPSPRRVVSSRPLRQAAETESYHTPDSTTDSDRKPPFWQTPTTMFANVHTPRERSTRRDSVYSSRLSSRTKSGFSSTRTPIISTDQMCDWHAMMISLMWNVQAWRDWIQENIDRALAYQRDPSTTTTVTNENWVGFQRRVTTESLQWRQYNIFSRQLTLRLSLRYRDTLIVSPTRATNRTQIYMECQQEMLEIIDMFNRWTQWLTAVVKETDSIQQSSTCDLPLHEVRWLHFKKKVQEYSADWNKYNNHLKICWENKYRSLISEWLPGWKQPGPVWVVSACGAVPSGAVAGGLLDNELVWVARTTHRCNVLPAALHPSKHCCVVYADGAVHHYTKYQVMCNAEASWVAWRAGGVGARAVRVAHGVYVGRVHYRSGHLIGAVHAPHYRCHVVIFGRPFAFNCYELLVLDGDEA